MRRTLILVAALVISATVAACTGMSGPGMGDTATTDNSMNHRSTHNGGGY
jgi:hypothetical protein